LWKGKKKEALLVDCDLLTTEGRPKKKKGSRIRDGYLISLSGKKKKVRKKKGGKRGIPCMNMTNSSLSRWGKKKEKKRRKKETLHYSLQIPPQQKKAKKERSSMDVGSYVVDGRGGSIRGGRKKDAAERTTVDGLGKRGEKKKGGGRGAAFDVLHRDRVKQGGGGKEKRKDHFGASTRSMPSQR